MTPQLEEPWAIVAPMVWDGHRKRGSSGIIIKGAQIVDVVSTDQIPVDVQTTRFDDCMVIPGLIDGHVHLSDWMIPGFLAAGVTTVRDTGNDLHWILERKRKSHEMPWSSPRILMCGPLLDGPEPNWKAIGRAHSQNSDVARSVEELAAAGVDAIKLYVGLNAGMVQAAIEAAATAALPIVAHVGSNDVLDVIRTCAGELQHLSGLIDRIDGARFEGESISQLLSRFIGVPHCPTLVVWDRLARINDGAFPSDSRLQWVHPDIRTAWDEFPHRDSDTTERLNRQSALVDMKRAVHLLHQGNGRIIAGSDTPWPYLVPGFSLHDELALLVDAGLTPTEALRSATVTASEVLGISDAVGSIAPGKSADLCIVAGDPTSEIRDLRAIRGVVVSGEVVDQVGLAKRAQESFASSTTDPVSTLIVEAARKKSLS